MSLSIGFTGTREGMTGEQYMSVRSLVMNFWPVEVHHGDCIGADSEFHNIARVVDAHIVGHPPLNSSLRAFRKVDEEREPKGYLGRDHDIILESNLLIAAPKSRHALVGGTAWTIRDANKVDRWVLTVWPDGKVDTN